MVGAANIVERIVGQGTKREQISIEQRELTLPFERVRIARSIRIVHGSRFHLVACVEFSRVACISHAHKNCRGQTMKDAKILSLRTVCNDFSGKPPINNEFCGLVTFFYFDNGDHS
jgi:hypothetical protein